MPTEVLLDANAVFDCRRRVHLDNDPAARDVERALPDPAIEARIADATAHRDAVAASLRARVPDGWVGIDDDAPAVDGELATLAAMRAGARFIWGARLPRDPAGGRRGRVNLLVRNGSGYVPVLVVRHKITDNGEGARTSPLDQPWPAAAIDDDARKVRPQPKDQLRLAHALRMLQTAGFARAEDSIGGVIGVDADVLLWHDLSAPTWPGGRSAFDEYDARFADRLAIATAAATRAPALAQPSRIVQCRHCPWWLTCDEQLRDARDVSLVVRGEDANTLRAAGVRTVDALAALDPGTDVDVLTDGTAGGLTNGRLHDVVLLARAWLADLTMARRTREIRVPRADVELDVDMESFGESGAYLWGTLLTGADIGRGQGYRGFVTWDPLPTNDEARSFAEFWRWLTDVRSTAGQRGLSFRAYCYNELAENHWLLASASRFAGLPGIPGEAEVRAFIGSAQWVDLYQCVADQFLCARGKGLKVLAPVAGFHWRDAEAGGENSMRWYRAAVGMDGAAPEHDQRERLLRYNEDDVRATHALRHWMSAGATNIPLADDLPAPGPNNGVSALPRLVQTGPAQPGRTQTGPAHTLEFHRQTGVR